MANGNLLRKYLKYLGSCCIGLLLSTQASSETIQGALEKTVRSNPEILITSKDRLATNQALKQAKGRYLPTLDVTAGYGYENSRNSNTNDEDHDLARGESAIAINQMLFDGFATPSEVKRNKARVTSAAYKVAGTSQDIALQAAQAYLEVIRREKYVVLARKDLSVHQDVFDMIQKRSETGIGKKADLVQADGRLALARKNLLTEESNLKDAETTYCKLVGEKPHHLIMPTSPPQHFFPKTESQALEWALAKHPTLKSAKADMAAARQQHEAAKSTHYPRFDLQLSASRNHNLDGIDGVNNDELAMVRMNYNLLNGGRDLGRQRETAYLYQESAEVMHKTHRETMESMLLSWNALSIARREVGVTKAHRDASAETVDAYQKQFQLGQRTLLDLLDAENEYYTAARDYADILIKEREGQYRVLNSMGCLLQALNVPLPKESTLPNRGW